MIDGTFITITGFSHYKDKYPFPIGAVLLCAKDPENAFDTEAIRAIMTGGEVVGYVANSSKTKANGTMSAARIYDRVGDFFTVEVWFSTQSKIICKVLCEDERDEDVLCRYIRSYVE